MAIKRLNYFDHQLLVEADFTAEQRYHLDMRRRLNQRLYTAGIVDGLEVTKSGDKVVTVSRGAAIDRLGQEMFLEESDQRVVDLSPFPGGTSVFIIIAYKERKSDPATTGVPGDTRVTEQPVVGAVTALPTDEQNPVVPLAHFTLDAAANVPDGLLDGGAREMVRPRNERWLTSIAGVSHPGDDVVLVEGTGITISPRQEDHSITIAASGTQGLVSVEGVSNPGGNIDLVPGTGIGISTNQTNHSITIANQGLVSVEGVSNPGGNIDLVPGTGIGISTNQTDHSITIGTQGLLLASEYDLRQRALKTIQFNEGHFSGTRQTVLLGFRPRLVLMLGNWSVSLLPLSSASFSVGITAFASILWNGPSPTIVQECSAIDYVILSATDWSSSDGLQRPALFYSQSTIITDPEVSERLEVTIVDVSESGFKTMLSRIIGGDFEVFSQFKITLTLLCIGG